MGRSQCGQRSLLWRCIFLQLRSKKYQARPPKVDDVWTSVRWRLNESLEHPVHDAWLLMCMCRLNSFNFCRHLSAVEPYLAKMVKAIVFFIVVFDNIRARVIQFLYMPFVYACFCGNGR